MSHHFLLQQNLCQSHSAHSGLSESEYCPSAALTPASLHWLVAQAVDVAAPAPSPRSVEVAVVQVAVARPARTAERSDSTRRQNLRVRVLSQLLSASKLKFKNACSVRSATARDSPFTVTVCCRSRDPAGYGSGCRTMESAVLESVGNSWMGVAVDAAGDEGGLAPGPIHFA